ncbi:MAG TPA: DUF1583 domain-containing protein, partial [Isosphaeraceae bacterium]|nr:DUF1583 domain-containing protein [Isosphaeraceae bacterium]
PSPTEGLIEPGLDGEPISERRLEPTDGRRFGLLHDADETGARVRHVVYEGRWPRELPPDLRIWSPGGKAVTPPSGG